MHSKTTRPGAPRMGPTLHGGVLSAGLTPVHMGEPPTRGTGVTGMLTSRGPPAVPPMVLAPTRDAVPRLERQVRAVGVHRVAMRCRHQTARQEAQAAGVASRRL